MTFEAAGFSAGCFLELLLAGFEGAFFFAGSSFAFSAGRGTGLSFLGLSFLEELFLEPDAFLRELVFGFSAVSG